MYTSISPRKDCGAFINLDKFATGPKLMFCCPKCAQPLCSSCKADHRPLSCAQYLAMPEENRNLEDAAFLQLAKQEKFARCLQCGQFVQLIEGCNHMTCKCSFQFCYECNAKWKTCPCSVWDEQRLIRAGQVEAGPRRNDVAVVGRRMQELVRAEYCDPHDWVRVNSGDRQCQNCPFYMYVYHYKCTECNRRICYTCRFYRI